MHSARSLHFSRPYQKSSKRMFPKQPCHWGFLQLIHVLKRSKSERKNPLNTVFYTSSSPAGCLKDLFKQAIPLANRSINCKIFAKTLYLLLCRNRRKFYQKSKPSDRPKAKQPQCPATSAAIRTAGQHDQEHYLTFIVPLQKYSILMKSGSQVLLS